jgi:predicted RND superfamily exporter protein
MLSKLTNYICQKSIRHPYLWLLAALCLCIPALQQAASVRLDADPIRLLPKNSRASELTRELEPILGERSFFYVLFKGENPEALLNAVQEAALMIEAIEGIQAIEYRHPTDFFAKYRYLLIPLEFLERLYDTLLEWESEVSPLGANLLSQGNVGGPEDTYGERMANNYIQLIMSHYGDLPQFHQNPEGTLMGITVTPREGLTDLWSARLLAERIEATLRPISEDQGVWISLGGAMNRWITGYNIILSDIKRSSLVLITGIVLALLLGFRTLRVVPLLFFPLLLGLTGAMGLVPTLVGDFNTITSFCLVVSFGIGIDFSIHLLKRYQKERAQESLPAALQHTFATTGRSVFISGLTTAAAFLVLGLSRFRGIAEFGIIGGTALILVMLAMILFMPAAIVLGDRWGLLPRSYSPPKWTWIPSPRLAGILAALTLIALVYGVARLRLDYDFTKLGTTVTETPEVRESQDQVFPSSVAPSAFFVAEDETALDDMLALLKRTKAKKESYVGWIRSVRDFCPHDQESAQRLQLISDIKEQVQGRWIQRLDDPEREKWVADLSEWIPPESQPEISELPEVFRQTLITHEQPPRYVIAVYSEHDPRNGKNAMSLTQELYAVEIPEGVRGPCGETPVVAELLRLVKTEGPWLVLGALACVVLLIWLNLRSLRQTGWTIVPLITGLGLTVGIMALTGLQLNFYNIVVLPALMGMGVDDGVHFYRRWLENGGDSRKTQRELLGPLSLTTVTTMLGYAGLILARHPGLQSIGILACLGMACTWATSMILLPGLLAARTKENS